MTRKLGRPGLALLTLGLAGCSSSEPSPVVEAPCQNDDDCAEGQLCAVGRVREIELEAGDDARCKPASHVIGQAPTSVRFVNGGSALDQRLCVSGGLDRGAGAAADAKRARQLELLTAAGVHVIRLDFTWSEIEPAKGVFDASGLDPAVDGARAAGLEVLGIIAYGTPWASSLTEKDDKYPPDDPADYASYARALAKHFAGRVRRWELWNEPNGGWRFFRPKLNGDAAKYASMLSAAAAAIRDECADCQVLSAGLFFHSQVVNGALEFTQDLVSAAPGALADVDAFGIHPYPRYPPAVAPEDDAAPERSMAGMLADLDAVLDEHRVARLPYALTELGWPSFGTVDEPSQARFVARAMLLGAALGGDPLCWFNLADGPKHGSFPPEDDFGLYRFGSDQPGAPIAAKPSRDVLARLATLLQGAVPEGASDFGGFHAPAEGRFALDFAGKAGRVTAIWQLSETPTAVHVTDESRHVEDTSAAVVAQPVNGALDVAVSPEPLFIVP